MNQNIIQDKMYLECGKIDNFFNLPYKRQLKEYFMNDCLKYYGKDLVRYENLDRYASLERIEYKLKFSGKSFFLKQKNTAKFLYDKEKKKILYNNYDRNMLLRDLCILPRFDWIKQEYDKNHIHPIVFSGAVVRDILLGKLTNCEDIVKQYVKSLHVKNVNWKSYIRYLYKLHYPSLILQWLDKATTDINAAMEYIAESDFSMQRQFHDIVFQALALNKKINPKWSVKRMDEEHIKMTRELMQSDIEEKEQIPIHENYPEFSYPCKLLNTEREVFQEGKEMHHCIYTNYWNKIKQKKYLGISFSEPERFTLGLRVSENGYVFDQAYLKYDNKISQESQDMINVFLNDPNVQVQLNKLEYNYIPTEIQNEIRHEEMEYDIRREVMLEPEDDDFDDNDENWIESILIAKNNRSCLIS